MAHRINVNAILQAMSRKKCFAMKSSLLERALRRHVSDKPDRLYMIQAAGWHNLKRQQSPYYQVTPAGLDQPAREHISELREEEHLSMNAG
jgi:hypothetical protein